MADTISGSKDAQLEFPIKTKTSTRFADVGIPSKKIDYEFDGYAHSPSKDKIRNKELSLIGWKTIRFNTISQVKEYIEGELNC